MKVFEIVKETTTAGSVATAAQPMGQMISRSMYNKDGTMKNGLDFQNVVGGPSKPKKAKKRRVQHKYNNRSVHMRDKEIQEGLADLAQRAEMDHEVQMARSDLYKIAKYAIKLHDMLKNVSESEGLEGWQQSKITKAADYMGSVYHAMDYDMQFGEQQNESAEPTSYKDSLAQKLAQK